MKIYLCDRLYVNGKSDWHGALSLAFSSSFQQNETRSWNEPEASHPAFSDKEAALFCHSSGGEPKWRQKATNVDCHIILIRGEGKQKEETNDKGNLHGCYWSPAEITKASEDAAPPRLAQCIEQIASGSSSDVRWSLLRPAATERLWALRLLCEAFLESRTKPNVEGHNWLELIGKDDEPPTTSPEAVIQKICADYDDLSPNGSTAITTFLCSLKSEVPRDEDQVRACLSKLDSILGAPPSVATN